MKSHKECGQSNIEQLEAFKEESFKREFFKYSKVLKEFLDLHEPGDLSSANVRTFP